MVNDRGRRSPDSEPAALRQILGVSNAIRRLKSLIVQVAPSDITVLISGESGTGKELVAQALHSLSPRRNKPLITINCGAIPEGIFESEIFGHEKGSFTSADQRRKGYFEMADRGSIFLDEIGEMPLSVQVKLLRVIETGRFTRVGGSQEISVDVRLIAATNKELGQEASTGRFRSDLYFRLNAVNLLLPPLRERPEDVDILATHFAREFADRNHRVPPEFEPAALDLLRRSYWAGNVRELRNFVESLIALNRKQDITAADVRARLGAESLSPNLPVKVPGVKPEMDQELIYRTLLEMRTELSQIKGMLQQLRAEGGGGGGFSYADMGSGGFSDRFHSAEEIASFSLNDAERDSIIRALQEFGGSRRKAARALGIAERTLYRKIKEYKLN